ncbi:MAG: transcriptional repressor [Clostridiales Family XIII bacterium]|jgi:Fe2+ or Zn2+ uptake regulation protein|nr:transcriptional repressor [Clostridiales Family XIII bacterium]
MSETKNIANREIMEELRGADVRPSTTRVHVLKYLREHRNHPTVDRIYQNLIETLPGLSRTSVYNTIGVLERAGLVRPLSMEGGEMRYDAFTEDHAHFQCERCGAIFDVPLNASGIAGDALREFRVKRLDVLFWGLCPLCAKEHRES